MANDWYVQQNDYVKGTTAKGEDVSADYAAIEDGFDKLPAPSTTSGEGFSDPVEVGNATSTADAPNVGQLRGAFPWRLTDGGSTANTYVLSGNPTVTSYADKEVFRFVVPVSATGGSTIKLDALSSLSLYRPDGTAIQDGDMPAGLDADVTCRVTYFTLNNPAGSANTISTSDQFKVSSTDTTAGYASSKILAGNGIEISTDNDGANENLRIKATNHSSFQYIKAMTALNRILM